MAIVWTTNIFCAATHTRCICSVNTDNLSPPPLDGIKFGSPGIINHTDLSFYVKPLKRSSRKNLENWAFREMIFFFCISHKWKRKYCTGNFRGIHALRNTSNNINWYQHPCLWYNSKTRRDRSWKFPRILSAHNNHPYLLTPRCYETWECSLFKIKNIYSHNIHFVVHVMFTSSSIYTLKSIHFYQ